MNNTRSAFSDIRKLTQEKTSRLSIIKDKNGKILVEKDQVIRRVQEYCCELFTKDPDYDETTVLNELERLISEAGENSPDITREEVELAIKSLKNNKSPGFDNIPAELIKNGGEYMIAIMFKLCQQIWRTRQMPNIWTKIILILLPKKGDLKECSNYRTISLICHASKILLKIINVWNKLARSRDRKEDHLRNSTTTSITFS